MTQDPRRELDLTEFRDLNAAAAANRARLQAATTDEERLACKRVATRISEERAKVVTRRFPSTAGLRWAEAFRADPDMLGRVLRDILKEERTAPGHRGPRFGLERTRDMAALDRLRGLDPTRHPYSMLEFPITFGLLMGTRSVRHTASKLGWPPSKVDRLRRGTATPTMEDLEHIAEGFERHPGYFLEYRRGAILEAVTTALGHQPGDATDVTIGLYERIWSWALRSNGGTPRAG